MLPTKTKVAVSFLQTDELLKPNVVVNGKGCAITEKHVAVQFFESVTVTVYVPTPKLFIVDDVALVFHK